MRKKIGLSIFIVIALIIGYYVIDTSLNPQVNEMKQSFQKNYPMYEIVSIENAHGFGNAPEYVVEYTFKGEKYRAWIDEKGMITESEKINE